MNNLIGNTPMIKIKYSYNNTEDDAINMARLLNKKLGLGVGISSGANFLGAILLGEYTSNLS